MSKREESRKKMYLLLEKRSEEGKIYDLTYDHFFNLEDTKSIVDIMIDEVLILNEDEDLIEKLNSLNDEETYNVAIDITKIMHERAYIDDSIYTEAISNIKSSYEKRKED